MTDKTNKIISREGLIILMAVVCFVFSGCSSLVLKERQRALDEAYDKGKIDKVQYLTSKNKLEQEEVKLESQQKDDK